MATDGKPSQLALADVLEAIGDAVYAMDEDERILFANRRALELWGKNLREVLGQRLLDVFPGIAGGNPYRAYRTVLATRRPMQLEATAPALDDRWIELDIRPAPQGGLVVVFRDIDDRKRAEAALRDSEERFRSMLEALPQIAFVIAPDGRAVYYNRQFRDYAGAPIGPGLADRNALLHPEDVPKLMEARRDAAAAAAEYIVEARMRRHDGAYRWHRIQNRPMRSGERIAYWLGTAVDIDDIRHANERLEQAVAERMAELESANRRLAAQIEEREAAEAQLRHAQRIEAVGQLTAGIAHDFNNLLTSIIGNIELVEARLGASDERTARLLGAALAAAGRGASLTAQLLAFSRQQRMHPEALDLNQVIDGIVPLLHSTIGATIHIDIAPGDALWPALADASQIELVLLNLAINSRDAMPNGGMITVATGNYALGPPQRPEEPPAGDYVGISVTDTGAGIPADILGKVFDPFFTTKEVGRGSGLGLSQVLGVAQQLGGGVRIETEPGMGTVVTVFLPRAEALADELTPRGRTGRRRHDRLTRQVSGILLVDDDPDVRAVAATMLREAGHTVIEAGSGGAALERLVERTTPIDLLIADLAMPGMNGFELARAARQERPDLPVLFVTGFADMARSEDSRRETVLQKPFRAEELTAKVAEVLG
ncbi:MAG TPA: PAS domain-containing protein [Stellaceae bacterium]|nr:PAS domain-containing protein [Stellaceae bacterium]